MSKLQERLTRQLASRGVKGARNMANGLLEKRGHLKDGKLTTEGKERQSLGNAGRAKDRAVKAGGGKPSDYTYNAKTNSTKKKK
jgi:hypothetical protein